MMHGQKNIKFKYSVSTISRKCSKHMQLMI